MGILELRFGALTKSVSEQLQEQFGDPNISLPEFDKDAEAIVRVYVRGIILDSESRKARKRLMKKIANYLNTHPLTNRENGQRQFKTE